MRIGVRALFYRWLRACRSTGSNHQWTHEIEHHVSQRSGDASKTNVFVIFSFWDLCTCVSKSVFAKCFFVLELRGGSIRKRTRFQNVRETFLGRHLQRDRTKTCIFLAFPRQGVRFHLSMSVSKFWLFLMILCAAACL